MPGIVGLITKMPRELAQRELRQMVQGLCQEPSYVTNCWSDESLGVYVGWTARKNSFCDGMPITNERGDVSLIFSGEEYPEAGTALRLKTQGHRVETAGFSYLVHLAEEDPAFPADLNGRFHGLLTDRTRGTASLFNDRYGMHRISYHESKEAFYFATEAKAILAVHPELRKAAAQGLAEFISCGCVLENRTLFEGIQVLPPASKWVFEGGALKQKGFYFDQREWEEQTPLDPESYYRELREVFSRNLPRYFNGPEPIGMSLTGGLDTRMILAWQKAAPGTVKCYSFGGTYRDCQDVVMARRVAAAWKQPHEVITVGKEFLSRFPKYAERTVYLTDGCMGVPHAPDLYANERAAEIAPVRMTGNYGGEVLRRVRAFKPGELTPGLFQPELLSHIHTAAKTYSGLLQGHPLSFAVFKQAPWHHYGLLALEESQLSQRSPYLDNDFVRTVFRAPASCLTSNDVSLRLIADGDAALRRIRTDRGLGGDHSLLTSMIMQGHLEFTFKAEYAYDYGMPQWVSHTDHVFAPLHLERLFLGRHKFCHFRTWYRDALGGYVQEMLLDSRTLSRPYLNRNRVEEIVRSHVKEGGNYTTEIHKLLTLELVHRLFLDLK